MASIISCDGDHLADLNNQDDTEKRRPRDSGSPVVENTVEEQYGGTMTVNTQRPVKSMAIAGTQIGFQFYNSPQFNPNDHRRDIITWLSPPDPLSNYDTARKKRLHGTETGGWFINRAKFTSWRTTPKSFIWLYGIPGCGKTVLSASIIEDISRTLGSSSAMIYFYFDFNDDPKRRYQKMVRSIVLQLCLRCKKLPKSLDNLYASCTEWNREPAVSDLLDILKQTLNNFDHVYLVLDALDECRDKVDVLDFLEELLMWELDQLHTLVTSRMEEDILSSFSGTVAPDDQINLQSDLVNEDIRVYIEKRLLTDRGLGRWKKQLDVKALITERLLEKADGMFRWAVCQLDALRVCVDLPRLLKALESLPATLYATYDRILCDIAAEYTKDALKILQWLAYSARPLLIEEVVEVIAVRMNEEPPFDRRNRLPNPDDILTICSSLVSVIEENYSSKEGNVVKRVVRLAHFSVREYLVSDRIKEGPASTYIVSSMAAHEAIAQICVTYLLHFDTITKLTLETVDEHPLSRYAAEYWTRHARCAAESSKSEPSVSKPVTYSEWIGQQLFKYPLLRSVGALLNYPAPIFPLIGMNAVDSLSVKLLLSTTAYSNWIKICDPDRPETCTDIEKAHSDIALPLYYAALAGLLVPVKYLLDKGAQVNIDGGRLGRPLHAASFGGHYQVVSLLLQHRAVVNAQRGEYATPLYAAADQGHTDVVQLLVDNGAKVNIQGGGSGTALQRAAEKGHKEVVKYLLDKGAQIDSGYGRYGNALQPAAAEGHEDVCRLLLERHPNVVHAKGGIYGTCLLAAVWPGHGKVLTLLLDKGADVNEMHPLYSNALYGAAFQGNKTMMVDLLERNPDLSLQLNGYGTPLYAAALGGFTDIVDLLLNKGVDINKEGGYFGNPLQAAARNGHTDVVRLLLVKGASITNECGFYGTALFAAYDKDHKAVAKLLQEEMAKSGIRIDTNAAPEMMTLDELERLVTDLECNNADPRDETYGNALQAAVYQGNESTVRKLLDYGVDANAQGRGFGKPLYAAADRGHASIVQYLIEKGADVDAQGRGYGNALQAAAQNGNAPIVRLLLQHGADVSATCGLHNTALHAAAYEGHENALQVLIENGADVNAVDPRWGTTVLQAACWGGNKDVVILLLEKDAKVDTKGGAWGTAMQAAELRRHDAVVDLLNAYVQK